MSKTANKFAPEVRDRAVRMEMDHGGEYMPRCAAVVSLASKICCSAHTLNEWVKKAELDSGRRAGVLIDLADNPQGGGFQLGYRERHIGAILVPDRH